MALIHTTASGQRLPATEQPTPIAAMLQQRQARVVRRRVVPLRPEIFERGFWTRLRLL